MIITAEFSATAFTIKPSLDQALVHEKEMGWDEKGSCSSTLPALMEDTAEVHEEERLAAEKFIAESLPISENAKETALWCCPLVAESPQLMRAISFGTHFNSHIKGREPSRQDAFLTDYLLPW